MKDFNKLIKEQILQAKPVKGKAVAIDLIDKQTATNDEKKEYEKLEELYYKFFIDTTLVKIIENQIKNITCEEDMYKTVEVSINYYLYRSSSESYDLRLKKNRTFSTIRGMFVCEPDIGEIVNVDGEDVSDIDMYLIRNVLPKWILLHNQLSFYTWDLSVKYDSDDEKYIILSFTSSLQKLIDMYYAEKQREEEKNRLNNPSKKK